MKKHLFFVIFSPILASAQSVDIPTGGVVNIDTPLALADKIGFVVIFFGSLTFAISVLIFLYAGFLYLTAGENEDNTTKARQFLTWGVVGLIVALTAWSLPLLIASVLGGSNL